MNPVTEPVLFDCDNTFGLPFKEIDDGLALIYLLGRPELDLLGVTTTFGNGTGQQACTQTRRLLASLGRAEVPVYPGAGCSQPDQASAARFLADTVAARPGEITLLATGPLGNLRAAGALHPGFFRQLKRLVIMGGNRTPPRIGWRRLPDLNFAKDPQAAWTVLRAPCEKTVMDMHVCLQAPFTRQDLDRLRGWPAGMRRTVRSWLLVFGAYCGVGEFYLWDLLPAVFLSYPELFDRNPVCLASTLADLKHGRLVEGAGPEGVEVNLPTRIHDPARFKEILFETWGKVFRE